MVDQTPIIILVEPQLGENIGSAARVMANFGLSDLRLVRPRDGWPNPKAEPLSAGALSGGHVQARVFDTLAEAAADAVALYATTARPRDMVKPVLSADEAISAMRALPGRSAILFGGESSGLSNDEIAASNAILTLPVQADFSSLNLSQAVGVCAYAWAQQAQGLPDFPVPDEPLATHKEVEGLHRHLIKALKEAGFFHLPTKQDVMERNIRAPFTRAHMTAQEVRTLRGCIRALEEGPRRKRPKG